MRSEIRGNLPRGNAADNNFGALLITSDTTHKATLLPDSWSGRDVTLLVRTATVTVDVALSPDAGAEVDRNAASSAGGNSTKVGIRLQSGVKESFRLPTWGKGGLMYLIHEASADATALEAALQL
jgi:hypothetical protein